MTRVDSRNMNTIVERGVIIKNNTKQGYDIAAPGDSINLSYPKSETRRGRVGRGVAQTLLTGNEQGVVTDED